MRSYLLRATRLKMSSSKFALVLLLLMQNLQRAGQALIAFLSKFFTEPRPEFATRARSALRQAERLSPQVVQPYPAAQPRAGFDEAAALLALTLRQRKSLSTQEGNNRGRRNCQPVQAQRAREALDFLRDSTQ